MSADPHRAAASPAEAWSSPGDAGADPAGGRERPPFGSWVPGNAWDRLDGVAPERPASVSVVVAHYEQPRELERTLRALARQDYPAELVQVIVADDGSARPPEVPPGTVLVRQEDLGFRAAAARNLGAAAATGDVLCFLDADTSPEPGYLRAATRLPALAPETVVVGRRRHAELAGTDAGEPVEAAGPARKLTEPAWLADEYRRSGNLLRADDRSYRFVISAVLTCTRWFFETVGGFDESFQQYGGEDWEWAHRAWAQGALLAHEPLAVAWHDGPDWADRSPADARRAKNAETLALADRIPVAGSRGRALTPARPEHVVRLRGPLSPAAAFVCADGLLAALPACAVAVEDDAAASGCGGDRRVVPLAEAPDAARVTLDLEVPVALLGASPERLRAACAGLGCGEVGEAVLRLPDGTRVGRALAVRAAQRRRRWAAPEAFRTVEAVLDGAVRLADQPDLEAYLGGWASPRHLCDDGNAH